MMNACFKDGYMVRYQFSKLVITIIMYLDNHDYKNHDDLIIVTKNNHDISICNDNCPTLSRCAVNGGFFILILPGITLVVTDDMK